MGHVKAAVVQSLTLEAGNWPQTQTTGPGAENCCLAQEGWNLLGTELTAATLVSGLLLEAIQTLDTEPPACCLPRWMGCVLHSPACFRGCQAPALKPAP